MQFAVTLPIWGYLLAFATALALAWAAYRQVAVPLGPSQWAVLTSLRAATLVLIVAALLRPVAVVPAETPPTRTVPLLLDISRSMSLRDEGDGPTRLERAQAIGRALVERLGPTFRVEWLGVGEGLTRLENGEAAATAPRSDLTAAIQDAAARYRADNVPGLVVLSDGGDTSETALDLGRLAGLPVFTVGIGSAAPPRDREVVSVTAGEALLPDAAIDLSATVVSRGYGTEPVEMRLLANGRPTEIRRIAPSADGAPVHQVFTVAPSPDQPTVYAIEVPAADGEVTTANNTRAVLVAPPVARRTVLIVEGAPGFEHTFLKRALATDQGLDVDAVVRKGQNDDGEDTFFVQAGERRAAALAEGYPTTFAALSQYDAIVFGNVSADFFTRDQLELTRRFVAERGGGLLVLGGRSFEREGLSRTALAEVLPVDLADRRARLDPVGDGGEGAAVNAPAVTSDGALHPATRLDASVEVSRRIWRELPPLASVALVGGPRPGAQVLAVTASPGGEPHPLIAVQRFGQGRAMVFAGEASWRWRMMRPAADTAYDTIWRQLVRWLAAPAPGQVSMPAVSVTVPGTTSPVPVTVRDERFAPVADAEVSVVVTAPDGSPRTFTPVLSDAAGGRYSAAVRFDQPGVYALSVDARRQGAVIGVATRHVLVGGVDLEMADPRLNRPALARLASATGGADIDADRLDELAGALQGAGDGAAVTEQQDLWHNVWVLSVLLALLAAEWLARRRWGLA